MKPAVKALILVYIFAGGLLGRAWIFSQTHMTSVSSSSLATFQKENPSTSNAGGLETILTKIIKKRRKETLNFAKVFDSGRFIVQFNDNISPLIPKDTPQLFSAELPPFFKPPI